MSRAAEKQREQRVITGALAVLVVSVLLVYGALPFARRVRLREAQIDAAQRRASLLAAYASRSSELERAAAVEERALSMAPRRVLHAASEPLAASALQSLLQEAAEGAGLAVNRVEVSSGDDSTLTATADGAAAVSGSLSAYGDVHGLAALLRTLEAGPRVVRVERITVQQNSALRGASDVLQVTIAVRAPVIIAGAPR